MADISGAFDDLGKNIGHGIAGFMARRKAEQDQLDQVQGFLDVAKRIQTQDQKSGKPKNFFSDQQVQDIQRLIDLRQVKAAAAQEAAYGIGKGMVDHIQGAAAREHLAQQGPITASKGGVTFVFNPKSMAWQQVTAVPRNEVGMTATSQITAQQRAAAGQASGDQTQQKAFDSLLKGAGLSRSQLFDASTQEHGTFNPDTGFEPTNQPTPSPTPTPGMGIGGIVDSVFNAMGAPGPGQLNEPAATPTPTPAPSPTHVRVGYRGAQLEALPEGSKKTPRIIDKGDPGHIVPMDQLQLYQDAAAKLAGPQAYQALQYMRASPDTSATDVNGNAWTPDSIKQYQQMAPQVAKKFNELVVNPEAKPAQTPQASTKPDTGITNIYGQPANPTAPASKDDGEED